MIKKILAADLEVGMFVVDFNTPWMNHPFLASSKRIRKPAEIQIIHDHGIEAVYIDTTKGKDSAKAFAPEEDERPLRTAAKVEAPRPGPRVVLEEPPPGEEAPYEVELRRARQVYDEARGLVADLFRDARMGKSIDGERAQHTVVDMVESVFRNRDALLSLARLKSFDNYTFQHSLNVAVLALNLGAQLGILHTELLRLGVGALLHDLGKIQVPEEILNRRGPLSPEEFEVIKTHPAHGAKLIMQSDSVPADCAHVALNHHERYDGSGYPRALAGLESGKLPLIVAIADIYDAMTTQRVYQRRFTTHQALKRVYEWAGSHLHPLYVRKFIQCLGIYPTGTVVELDTGHRGVVYRQNREDILRPWVRVVEGPGAVPLEHPMDVDLMQHGANGHGIGAKAVQNVLVQRDIGFDVEKVLQPGGEPLDPRMTVVIGAAAS